MRKDIIRDEYNRIIGSIETDPTTGNQTARDFYGRVLGTWDSKLNVTRDFYGKIVSYSGNTLSGLILNQK